MKRRRLTDAQRIRIFDACHGVCAICLCKIHVGEPWQIDHQLPLWLAGEDAPENMVPVHTTCHTGKTSREHTSRAKGDRVRARHLGVKKTPRHVWGWGKTSEFKRKLDGTSVRRNQEGSK